MLLKHSKMLKKRSFFFNFFMRSYFF